MDEKTFNELYKKYREELLNIAYHMTKNYSDAEDIVQDVFLKAYEQFNTSKGTPFFAWAYEVLKNAVYNKTKKSNTEDKVEDKAKSVYVRRNCKSEDDYLMEDEIKRSIKRLPAKYSLVIWQHYIEGLSCKEIAEKFNIAEGTVKKRLYIGKKLLKERLK